MNKTYYMAWNPAGNEAFMTDDEVDAMYASTGEEPPGGVSSLAYEFRELYEEDLGFGDDFRITTISMPTVEEIR
ncbi:hypothetical protein PMW_96 [Pseudomonas phage phiPMW]|uniref:Uncharacterized protein n=1 Tax=Pseudomonas phage phiPMW TaxID=1815582 RepID=A0A1S5R1D2_9CAUD|nr:hypothetical protein FDG97_gp096 [Pseudomonas phage phiPMW]ANA49221.1 hypothetical protein PMW_96 [Pseudomonas phage phiPMW]